MYDFHLHCNFSLDSKSTMEEMVVSGIRNKLKGMCFTDHIDLDYNVSEMDMNFIPKDYFKTIYELRVKYKDDIEILAGIELGMQPHLTNIYNNLITSNSFDFVIMSIHNIDGKDIYFDDYVNSVSPNEAIKKYYDAMYMCVQTFDNFDTLGHIDFIDRYFDEYTSLPKYEEYSIIIDSILKTIIAKGKCLEINTAGLKYGLDYFHPKLQILNRYKDLGGKNITIGSDSHSPEYIGYEFHKTKQLLKEIGFSYYSIFKERRMINIKI